MQALADSIRKISISKEGILSAECRKADNKTWVVSHINLDGYIGNVDGKFIIGGKHFSRHAQDISFANGVLSCKFKHPDGHWLDHSVDISEYIRNNDGVLSLHGIGAAKSLALERTLSASSAASSASMASMSSMASMVSQSSSMTSVSSTSSQKTFKSSSFRQFSKQLLLQEVASDLKLSGTFLHCDVHHEDGRVIHVRFDLDLCVGVVNGALVWDAAGFSKHSTAIVLDGFWLTAKVRHPVHVDQFIDARLDLTTRLRVEGEVIICLETNKRLSAMLSEVPWMKFRVIAEPDLSVFSTHPVVQQTMVRIAESTVEHVTTEMHRMLTIAMESAIIAITASAMKHVSAQMEYTVQDAVGYAVASPSVTESEYLHISPGGARYGMGAYMGGVGVGNGGYAGGAYGAAGVTYGAAGATNGAAGVTYGAAGATYGSAGAAKLGAIGGTFGAAGAALGAIGAAGATFVAGGATDGVVGISQQSSGNGVSGAIHTSGGATTLSRSVSEVSSVSTSSESHSESATSTVSTASTAIAAAVVAK